MTTKIQWTEETWNPVTGCTKVSQGCKNCYAEGVAKRFWKDRKFTDVQCHYDRLDTPLKRKKPTMYFVNSMSDLFHEDVPDDFILEVFTVMAISKQHIFQFLTKRPRRMLKFLEKYDVEDIYCNWYSFDDGAREVESWPLPNVWLGVSCEDQKTADERIPILLQTPAMVRFISAEPLLGKIILSKNDGYRDHHDWVIVGGESGHGARPCNINWIQSIVDQCKAAGVPVFVKQLGKCAGLKDSKGGDMNEWPEGLKIREYPN